jgi:hypothetical protein
MTSRQLFVYCCNPVYIWDRTSGSHDMRGPVSIAYNSASFSEPDCTWWDTRNMISNSVDGCFPLWDSPLMFEIFPFPSNRSCSNLRLGQVRFCHSSHESGAFTFLALTQSCTLGNHYIQDITSGHSRAPIFRGGEAIVMTSRQVFVYRCNPLYVWDRTLERYDMRGPM